MCLQKIIDIVSNYRVGGQVAVNEDVVLGGFL